jgi:hypothetical protein
LVAPDKIPVNNPVKEEDFKISNILTGNMATICLRIKIVKAMDSANVQIKSAVKA